jgi:hypothetical protein
LAIDPNTGLKNYIANESGGWATSSGYIRHSFARSIHYGRVYTHGSGGSRGREEDLCEALRCLGQGLHTVEDFGAHSNYCELALRELGFTNVFPHTGVNTQMYVRGKHVFPCVTGTFGGVDFLHSVLGEATDHITQSEVEELDNALGNAASTNKKSVSNGGTGGCDGLIDLLSKIPGTGDLCTEARQLQAASDAEATSRGGGYGGGYDDPYTMSRASGSQAGPPPSFAAPPGSQGGPPGPGIPGLNPNFDPSTVVPKIYPILVFRDKVVRAISAVISKIPGLEKLIETSTFKHRIRFVYLKKKALLNHRLIVTERLTLWIMSLLAPFIQPIIKAASEQLKVGSSAVVDASGRHQYEPWTDPNCTDPTHSLLSKDHFSNILNEPAGQVASVILQYVAPRVIYAWDHPDVPVNQVLDDVVRVFHHPALRDPHNELHRNMFGVVEKWSRTRHDIDHILSSDSVRNGHNHHGGQQAGGGHGKPGGHGHGSGGSSHGPTKTRDSPWAIIGSGSGSRPTTPSNLGTAPYGAGSSTSPYSSPQPSPAFAPYPSSYNNYNDPNPVYPAYAPENNPGYQQYGASQSYYDHGQAPQAADYGSTWQSSYQQGYNDGGYQQQPPPDGYNHGPPPQESGQQYYNSSYGGTGPYSNPDYQRY